MKKYNLANQHSCIMHGLFDSTLFNLTNSAATTSFWYLSMQSTIDDDADKDGVDVVIVDDYVGVVVYKSNSK